MFDHIGIRVRDLDASVRFYAAVLAPLGAVIASRDATYAGFGLAKELPLFWLYSSSSTSQGGTHVALQAPDRAAVDRFHRAGLAAGGRDNGAPGVRADYAENYYAAFLLDPDGHNVEAVCMSQPSSASDRGTT